MPGAGKAVAALRAKKAVKAVAAGKAGPRSKTGDPACSAAVAAWKTTGMTSAIAKVLAGCHKRHGANSGVPAAALHQAKAHTAGKASGTGKSKGRALATARAKSTAAKASSDVKSEHVAKGASLDAKRRAYANTQEKRIATATGGRWLKDYEPQDAAVPKASGKGEHDIEVKSMIFGRKPNISVHENALIRKIDHAAEHPENTFHTVALDMRGKSEGGAHAANYSGNEIYYKRACGPYRLTAMYKVKDHAELNRLIAMPASKLPAAARGEFPKGAELDKLRARAKDEQAYNNGRSKERKKTLGKAAYGR